MTVFHEIKKGDYRQPFEVRVIEYGHEKVVAYCGSAAGAAEKADQCARRPGVTRAWFVEQPDTPEAKEAPKTSTAAPGDRHMTVQEAWESFQAKQTKG